MSLQEKIGSLLKAGKIRLTLKENEEQPHYRLQNILQEKPFKISIGQICKGIVVRKDSKNHELILHLTKLVNDKKQIFINKHRQLAFIKDYDLVQLYHNDKKEHFSIFTYVNTFDSVQIGTEIIGVITRRQKRGEQIYFEISIKNQILTPGQKFVRYGVTKFEDMTNLKQQGKYDKYNRFSLSYLALFTPEFQNNHLSKKLSKKLNLDMTQTLSPISNIPGLHQLNIDFQRIRKKQQKIWADEHFMEGMEFLKTGNNQLAIDHFDVAKRFDLKNQKIYIGKGCALANMNNLGQGLRQIKQALSINPNNQQANQYFKIIRQKIKEKQIPITKEGLQLKKKRMSNQYEILSKK